MSWSLEERFASVEPMVVLQADARRRGGYRAPLAVAVGRWRGQGDAASVVTKLTLAFDHLGDEVTATVTEPSPAEGAVPNEMSPGAYRNPTDFVLAKARRDVLLVGHAHAAEPVETIEAAVHIGDWRRGFVAVASSPLRSIPLLPQHCRVVDRPLRVGPGFVEREGEDDGFEENDFSAMQAASEAWQVPLDAALDTVFLTGLSPRGPHRGVHLPPLAPRAFFERRDGQLVELGLACDTLLLDTDHERLTLTWRGRLPEDDLAHVDRLVVSLEDTSAEARPLPVILGDLPRGTIAFATEEVGVPPGDPDELTLARYETLQHGAEPELPLEEYARICALLAEERSPRPDALAAEGFDEITWTIEDRAWAEALARSDPNEEEGLAERYGQAFRRAQDALAGDDEPQPIEVYVQTKRRLEAGERPDDVLREAGLSTGAWLRLERHWLERAATDSALLRILAEA